MPECGKEASWVLSGFPPQMEGPHQVAGASHNLDLNAVCPVCRKRGGDVAQDEALHGIGEIHALRG